MLIFPVGHVSMEARMSTTWKPEKLDFISRRRWFLRKRKKKPRPNNSTQPCCIQHPSSTSCRRGSQPHSLQCYPIQLKSSPAGKADDSVKIDEVNMSRLEGDAVRRDAASSQAVQQTSEAHHFRDSIELFLAG